MYPARFAAVYDRLMDDFDYPAWAGFYLDLMERAAGFRPGTLCECGCGTGSMSVEFAKAGIQVTGVDLSEPMLEIAAAKARKNGMRLMLVCQNMCALSLHRPVDAVACPCDGVNYLLTDEQLGAFFGRAYRHLNPGGALVFDVSTPEKLYGMDKTPFYEDREDLTYIWISQRRENLVDMTLTFFVRQGGGSYLRFDEEQTQRAYTKEELRSALEQAGFEQIAFYGDRALRDPLPGEKRWHVCAVRK